MNSVVIAFNYVNYTDKRRSVAQDTAIQVLSSHPDSVFPIAMQFQKSSPIPILTNMGIPQFNILKRNSKNIGSNRELPYIKEILEYCSLINCNIFGYINSDILLSKKAYDILFESKYDAYILSRSDIGEVTAEDFLECKYKVIHGGDTHCGADGFFFKREWWVDNRNMFHNDLIIGETEWDTCYRKWIEKSDCKYLEDRLLYHVYHDAKWDVNSIGGKNNKRILDSI